MIRLITATPGSGKTCLVIEWLIREIERGFYKEFYSNIEGLQITGIRPLPDDCDWRKLNPEKSKDQPPKLVIIDECQYIPAFMKENRSVNNTIGKDLSTHRHYGIDIWFITQSTKLLNDYVLENVGEHVHLFRPKKTKNVQVYWWSYVQKSLTKSAFKDADDKQIWRLNPVMFQYYKSTSQVTDGKGRISQKVVMALISFLLVALIILFFLSKGLDAYTKMKAGDTINQEEIKQSTNTPEQQGLPNIPLSDEDAKMLVSDNLAVEPRTDLEDEPERNKVSYDPPVYDPPTPVYDPPVYVPPTPVYVPPAPAPMPNDQVRYVNAGDTSVYVYNHDTNECIIKDRNLQVISQNPDDCKNKFQIAD